MKFKEERLKDELYKADTSVQLMAVWFEQLCLGHFGIEPTVTRVFDNIKGATGVHPAGRAVDIRSQYWGADGKLHEVFTPEQVKFLVSEMNRKFPGGDKYPSCLHHSFAGGPYHFHLQRTLGDAPLDAGCLEGVKSEEGVT